MWSRKSYIAWNFQRVSTCRSGNGGGPRVVRVFFEVGLQFALFGEVSKLVDKLW